MLKSLVPEHAVSLGPLLALRRVFLAGPGLSGPAFSTNSPPTLGAMCATVPLSLLGVGFSLRRSNAEAAILGVKPMASVRSHRTIWRKGP
jgi:hypothetical protein